MWSIHGRRAEVLQANRTADVLVVPRIIHCSHWYRWLRSYRPRKCSRNRKLLDCSLQGVLGLSRSLNACKRSAVRSRSADSMTGRRGP